MRRIPTLVACLSILTACASGARFSYTGTLGQDSLVSLFSFCLPSTSDVTVRTFGYAGGVNANGVTIAPGGFDPGVAIFDIAGLLIGLNDDAGCGAVGADPVTGACLDSILSMPGLSGGSYTLALFESPNVPVGPTFGDGFQFAGQGNYTCDYFLGTAGGFCDATLSQRTNAFAVDVTGASAARQQIATPEPGGLALSMSGLAAFLLAAWRRTRA